MRCPNCGKDVSDGQSYCNACGSVLYGPRNVNLKNPGKVAGSEQSNDISSITGIDINSLNYNIGDDVDYNDESLNEKKKKEHKKKNVNVGTLILISVIVCLLGFSIFLFISNMKLKKNIANKPNEVKEKKKEEEDIVKKYVTGYYGLASNYAFSIPNTWRYNEVTEQNSVVLTNDVDKQILIAGLVKIKYSELIKENMINEYFNEGNYNASLNETKFDNNGVIYVTRYHDGTSTYYTDYYIDYDGNSVLYGQINSKSDKAIEDDEVQSILKSIIVLDEKANIEYKRFKIDFEKVLGQNTNNQQA